MLTDLILESDGPLRLSGDRVVLSHSQVRAPSLTVAGREVALADCTLLVGSLTLDSQLPALVSGCLIDTSAWQAQPPEDAPKGAREYGRVMDTPRGEGEG